MRACKNYLLGSSEALDESFGGARTGGRSREFDGPCLRKKAEEGGELARRCGRWRP